MEKGSIAWLEDDKGVNGGGGEAGDFSDCVVRCDSWCWLTGVEVVGECEDGE